MRTFEFHAYPADEYGAIIGDAKVTTKQFSETVQAKRHAGSLARRCGGPVDIARAYEPGVQDIRDWSSRYITTASPSPFHASGYRLERLS